MAAQRYKISLQIFHEWAQQTSEIFFQHKKRNFVSPSGHVMFYLLYKHQWNTKPFHFNSFWCERRDLLCSHSNGDIFTCEDNMLFSHVKISSFRAKAHMVFHWCLYNNSIYYLFCNKYICHLHIPHNTPCLTPKILHKHCLQCLFGRL